MAFWVFMVAADLQIPVIMLLFGWLFVYRTPAHIGTLYGYRTSMSTKNMDTWNFAHHFCGKLWCVCGLILLLFTAAGLLLVRGKGTGVVGGVGGVICLVQAAVLVATIIPVEIALRKKFDRDGNRMERPDMTMK